MNTPLRVLIAHKNPKADNPDACHAGLGVTASNGIPAESFPVVDGYYLRDKLRLAENAGVTHVILSAPFFDTGFLQALCDEFRGIVFAVVFHSNVGFLGVDNWSQAVLGEEMAAMSRLHNFQVAGNCAKFCEAAEEMYGEHCAQLPNLYFLHGPIERKRGLWARSDGPLRIGAFGATRVLKNLPTAAWAAAIMARRLNTQTEFWVSSGREEGAGTAPIIAGIRKLFASQSLITLVEAPWAGWLEFRRSTVRRMHLLLQPSFTESFNGVTADGIAEGVPSVVSQAIDWVPASWIVNPDDAVAVAETGLSLLRDRNAPRDGYRSLVRHNDIAIGLWREFLAR